MKITPKTIAQTCLLYSILSICFLCGCSKNTDTQSTETHQHTFSEATCEKPRTCIECNETEGTALGHSTNIGKCKHCNTFINKDVWDNISVNIEKAETFIELGANYITSNVDSLEKCAEYYNQGLTYFNQAKSLCGNYTELTSLKASLSKMVSTTNRFNLYDRSKNSMLEFLGKLESFTMAETDVMLEYFRLKNQFN